MSSSTREKTIYHVANPVSLGGDFDIRQIKLTPAHLSQEDKSMNARLWEFFPLDAMECMNRLARASGTTRLPPG